MTQKREVYALLGVEPEVCGYALARFSRSESDSSFKDWVFAVIKEGAAWFYETFYHRYGHASIADQAHAAVIIEGISMVAAIECLHHQLLDPQERSTRYMDFGSASIVVPPELELDSLVQDYLTVCQELLEAYDRVHSAVLNLFLGQYLDQRPSKFSETEARGILSARAFDVARFLLPYGISTSLGFVASGRIVEEHVTRLLSQPLQELQEMASEIRDAVSTKTAFNPAYKLIEPLLGKLADHSDGGVRKIADEISQRLHPNAVALPTLVKYAAPSSYLIKTYKELEEVAAEVLSGIQPDGTRGVTLIENVHPEIDIVTTLFYKVSACSYQQIHSVVEAMSSGEVAEIIALAYRHRGAHDGVIRELGVGNLSFDVCQDGGSCRDMFRHRNCVQVRQRLTSRLGFDLPPEVKVVGLESLYRQVVENSGIWADRIDSSYPGVGQYGLPMAYRRRTLYRMHPAQLQYMVELRTKTQNHFSNREIAWGMFKAYQKYCPTHAQHFRVTPPEVVDFFER